MKTNVRVRVVDPEKVKPTDFNSKSFQRGLNRVNVEIEKMREQKRVDSSKLHLTYDI